MSITRYFMTKENVLSLGGLLAHDDRSQLTVVSHQYHLLGSQDYRYHTLWLCCLQCHTPLWYEDDVIVMSYLSGLVNQDRLEDKLGKTRISGSDTRTTDYISILRKQGVKVGNKRVKERN